MNFPDPPDSWYEPDVDTDPWEGCPHCDNLIGPAQAYDFLHKEIWHTLMDARRSDKEKLQNIANLLDIAEEDVL